MNAKSIFVIVAVLAVGGLFVATLGNNPSVQYGGPTMNTGKNESGENPDVSVEPIEHATAVLQWEDTVIYTAPVGGEKAFEGQPSPDVALVTHTHGDHMDAETLRAVTSSTTTIVVPQTVADALPEDLSSRFLILDNGESADLDGMNIKAIPMYNLPQSEDAYHVKGDGNGYVLERDDYRVYVAGDTSGISEMRALEGIDMAFVPMNLPYTMEVDAAADAVLDFDPVKVYPYHYRGQDGLHDIDRFKRLVEAGSDNIEVVLLDWYPDM